MSRNAITVSRRFQFDVPETVYDDLLQCYAHAVRGSGREMELTPDIEKVLRMVVCWMRSGKRGLLLCGSCGTGKTKIMQALTHLLTFYCQERTRVPLYSAGEIVKLSLSKDEKEMMAFEMLRAWPYLGIDDLGTEPVNVKNWGTDTNPIVDLLYKRYDKMRVTVLSTNLNVEKIGEVYGKRIFDRICESYDRISFSFQSFRQK